MRSSPQPEGETRIRRWTVDLEPDLACLADARRLVDRVADIAEVSEQTRYMLKLAVHEAVVNAMQHGAAFAAPVQLSACLDGHTVSFAVGDPGRPFALEAEREPSLHHRGRGLVLMRSCVDEVAQEPLERGKEVRLTKRLR
jgi:anti-sigma regulatory factor (Ser/Thr protein kinase)